MNWEYLCEFTYRLKVDGGYIYLYEDSKGKGLVFVPTIIEGQK